MTTTAIILLAFWTVPIWGPLVALAYWLFVVRPVIGVLTSARGNQ